MPKNSKYILCGRIAHYPAQQLRDQMLELAPDYGSILVTHKPEVIRPGKEVIIRFGNSQPLPRGVKDTDINTPESIRVMANKKAFSYLMQQNNIYSPIFYTWETRPKEYPVLVRTTLTGYGGEGIHFVTTEDEFNHLINRGWWTPFVRMEKEYRVHVIDGEVVKIFLKKAINNAVILTNENSKWVLLNKDKEGKFIKLRNAVEEVNKALHAKFFGLDVGWDSINKKYFVLEANSAPGGNIKSSLLYASRILTLLGVPHVYRAEKDNQGD